MNRAVHVSCLLCFITAAPAFSALTPRPDGAAYALDLPGPWKFHPAPPDGFWASDFRPGGDWADIPVPGEWSLSGFVVEPTRAAGYRRTFRIPAAWQGRRVILHCDSVYGESRFWINGQPAGAFSRTFTPFEIDATELVEPGRENTLAVALTLDGPADELTHGSKYAQHPLGGILREVSLLAVPPAHVARLHVQADLPPPYRDGLLRVATTVSNDGDRDSRNLALRLELLDPDGRPVLGPITKRIVRRLRSGGVQDSTLEFRIKDVAAWECEHPRLYTLRCQLVENGVAQERFTRRIGFRRVEVRGQQLLVNGVAVKLAGVCRHESHPLLGRALREPLWRRDAELYKAANVNFVRTSHYPPDERFIDACDELGIFVEEEAPLCWVYPPESAAHPDYLVEQTLAMIERDCSHPSVILWSLANESTWTPQFARALQLARAADPTRPFTFEDGSRFYQDDGGALDVESWHYPRPERQAPARAAECARPVLLGEYSHLNCYNRQELYDDPGLRDCYGRALLPVWDAIEGSPACIGGAIWSGISDAFRYRGAWVGYGDWGPLDGWRRQMPEYWHIKQIYSPIRVPKTRYNVETVGDALHLPVENRFFFTNLSELHTTWRTANGNGTASANVAPGARGLLDLRLPAFDPAGGTVELRFERTDGTLVEACELDVVGDRPIPDLPPPPPAPQLQETRDAYRVGRWTVDRRTGQLRGEVDGRAIVLGGPTLHLAPLGEHGPRQLAGWSPQVDPTPYFTDWKLERIRARRNTYDVVVEMEGHYAQATGKFTLHFDGSGGLRVAYDFIHTATDVNPREVGVGFELARACERLRWQRRGDWSVYPPDHIGRLVGEARPFRPGMSGPDPADAEPTWPWKDDATIHGSNDFRSSKYHVLHASLTDASGAGLSVSSDGSLAARASLESDRVAWRLNSFTTGGNDRFLATHFAAERRPIAQGGRVTGAVQLRLAP